MVAYFPTIAGGPGYSVFKEPQFKTRIQKAVSGREFRVIYQALPTWLFKLKYERLNSFNSADELQTIMGFFLSMQGSFSEFAFVDPTDYTITNQYIGTGDGVTAMFRFVRTMGGFSEPVGIILNTGQIVRLDGVVQDTGSYYFQGDIPNTITFLSPPYSGAVITSDFEYGFICRFADDTYSFENFLTNLWQLNEIKLQSVLL